MYRSSLDQTKVLAAASKFCCRNSESAGTQCDQIRPPSEDRVVFHRLVWPVRTEARDRLDKSLGGIASASRFGNLLAQSGRVGNGNLPAPRRQATGLRIGDSAGAVNKALRQRG
jgi:hypothetical protein